MRKLTLALGLGLVLLTSCQKEELTNMFETEFNQKCEDWNDEADNIISDYKSNRISTAEYNDNRARLNREYNNYRIKITNDSDNNPDVMNLYCDFRDKF